MTRFVCAVVCCAFLLICETCSAVGVWIAPDFGTNEPRYPARPLFWYVVENSPVVYRREIKVQGPVEAALVQVKTTGYCYVFVDRRQVFGWAPRERGEQPLSPQGQTFTVDLTGTLSPGSHVLWVSAPRDGMAMSGMIWYADGGREELRSDAAWKARKFPPSTVLEREQFTQPGAKLDGWVSVRALQGRDLRHSEEAMAEEFRLRESERQLDKIAECEWRLELLLRKGIVIENWHAVGGWGGSSFVPDVCRRTAQEALKRVPSLRGGVEEFRKSQAVALQRVGVLRDYASGLRSRVGALANLTEAVSMAVVLPLRLESLSDAAQVIGGPRRARWLSRISGMQRTVSDVRRDLSAVSAVRRLRAAALEVAKLRRDMSAVWGAPLNEPNESRFDKLGWIPHNGLTDSEMGDWGVRVNPAEAPWSVRLPDQWWFKTDPGNQGLAEKRETVGYNIDVQWPKLRLGESWESQGVTEASPNFPADSPYPTAGTGRPQPYDGYAWYRVRVQVPEAWRGYDLELVAERAKDWDWAYFNGEQVGHTGPDVSDWAVKERRYRVPAKLVQFGGENVVAWRVYNAGGEGMLGIVRLECPALRGAAVTGARAQVISTPLFPGVVLVPRGKVLSLWGWRERGSKGPAWLVMPREDGRLRAMSLAGPGGSRVVFDRNRGRMYANWAVLVPHADEKAERPIMLVFEGHPDRVTAVSSGDGTARIEVEFAKPALRVVALRPFRSFPAKDGERPPQDVQFWSRSALMVPVGYTELSRPDPAKKAEIQHILVYRYMLLRDSWGTRPLRTAPLPMLASRAVEKRFPGLRMQSRVRAVMAVPSGWAAYRIAENTSRVAYSYPRDTIKRLFGFTSWMFAPSDSGVPGNDRECELIASTGSNSFRPQHNFAGERVRILADYCRKYGLTYTNNIDETLGGPWQRVVEDYDGFMADVTKHLLSIVELLKDCGPYEVAYDLINEPFHHPHEKYNAAMKRLTAEIRKIDKKHLLYIEPCESWGAVEKLDVVQPTGDPLTVYSFHDYNFRLRGSDRWPALDRDVSSMYRQFLPAFRFMIDHAVVMHCGEFGGFEEVWTNPCALTIMADFLRVFDQFGMHFHYYPNRDTVRARADGSLQESPVHEAYRRWLAMGHLKVFWPSG
ncbi:MAG: cellulase family glycosylhydrolase [Armatimonadota bacterium]